MLAVDIRLPRPLLGLLLWARLQVQGTVSICQHDAIHELTTDHRNAGVLKISNRQQ